MHRTIVIFYMLLLVGCGSEMDSAQDVSSPQTVTVEQGVVQGVESPYTPASGSSVTVFRGLPYAQPPV